MSSDPTKAALATAKLELVAARKELATLAADRDRYKDCLYRRVINDAATGAIIRHGGRPGFLGLYVIPQLRVQEQDGNKFAVVVVGPDGKDRPYVTLDSVVRDMRLDPELASAFPVPEPKPGEKQTFANNPWTEATLNVTAQAKLLRSNPGLAIRMKAAAE